MHGLAPPATQPYSVNVRLRGGGGAGGASRLGGGASRLGGGASRLGDLHTDLDQLTVQSHNQELNAQRVPHLDLERERDRDRDRERDLLLERLYELQHTASTHA